MLIFMRLHNWLLIIKFKCDHLFEKISIILSEIQCFFPHTQTAKTAFTLSSLVNPTIMAKLTIDLHTNRSCSHRQMKKNDVI